LIQQSNQPLSKDTILSVLEPQTLDTIAAVEIHQTLRSTNDRLWDRLREGFETPAVCLSEMQTQGRGRRGDRWQSPSTGNLYLSIFWPFPANTTQSGLSIAIGITLINTLKAQGIKGLKLKWPNDILYKKQKLAGILVESRFGNRQNTVIGIGLNYKLPSAIKNKINQPTTSLQQLCTEAVPCRNRLAGHIIQNMIETLEKFQTRGLRDFLPQWSQYDALADSLIDLIYDDKTITVKACGISETGELQYQHNNQLHTLANSHVSIRLNS
jgi:BirA family biotin operon repressor/biotin-[acetyl-CoA-carboxylase] ligase